VYDGAGSLGMDSTLAPSPFRPTVAVTGHRAPRLVRAQGGENPIAADLDRVFGDVESACAVGAPKPRLVAGLATGADHIAAAAAHRRGWEIETVLPAPLADFLDQTWAFATEEERSDFAASMTAHLGMATRVVALPAQWRAPDAAERRALDAAPPLPPFALDVGRPSAEARTAVLDYGPAGLRLLAGARLLVAVWDGLASRGPGGTADVAAHAFRAGLPVVVVDAGGERRPRRLTGFDGQGRATLANSDADTAGLVAAAGGA
jgi:hypothetical protein